MRSNPEVTAQSCLLSAARGKVASCKDRKKRRYLVSVLWRLMYRYVFSRVKTCLSRRLLSLGRRDLLYGRTVTSGAF